MSGNPISFSPRRFHLFVPVFNYPLRRTGEARGTSGGWGQSGRQENGEKKGEDEGGQHSVVVLFCSSHQFGRGDGDTNVGFLSSAAETFMKSLQRQGGRHYFYLQIDSAAVAAVPLTSLLPNPPPRGPHSLLAPDLETYLLLRNR